MTRAVLSQVVAGRSTHPAVNDHCVNQTIDGFFGNRCNT
jgi:hypothetical protein